MSALNLKLRIEVPTLKKLLTDFWGHNQRE